jgi:hypothetical protein
MGRRGFLAGLGLVGLVAAPVAAGAATALLKPTPRRLPAKTHGATLWAADWNALVARVNELAERG